MSDIRLVHASDLHLGRRFAALPEDIRHRLVEARHAALGRLAQAARDHGAGHILLAGDSFDSGTPSARVLAQALAAIAADPALTWWMLPGNHDSLAEEELWSAIARRGPENLRLLTDSAPQEITPGVALLPAPLPRRYPGRDLTRWMTDAATAEGTLRIGLAHGAIRSFEEEALRADEVIPPDRAATAGLDYLGLGDWHGQMRIDARCWYSGTPERDGFRHGGRGACLAITLAGRGHPPEVTPVETGSFDWQDVALPLLPGEDGAAALAGALPATGQARRDMLLRIAAQGRATLSARADLDRAAEAVSHEFGYFALDTGGLATEVEATDLDLIDRGGALRVAAERLAARARDPEATERDREIASTALNRLFGLLSGEDA